MHVVQTSVDPALLRAARNEEAVQRQIGYLAELQRHEPGTQMTMVVLQPGAGGAVRDFGDLQVVPLAPGRFSSLALFRGLERLHRRSPISVVTTQRVYREAYGALAFGARRKVPIVGQVHFDIFNAAAQRDNFGTGVRGWMNKRLALRSLGRFTKVRVVGRRIGDEMVQRGLARADAVYLAPVPVPMLSGALRPSTHAEPRVLFVGRLVYQKNLHGWLEIAKRVLASFPEARFDLVGDGPLLAELRQAAENLGIAAQVTFHGHVVYEKLGDFYQRASVFLLTSHYEGYGRVLVEACGHCVPCVAFRIAGVEDIVATGKSGYAHEPGDHSGMAASVVALLRDRELSIRLGNEARAMVQTQHSPAALTRAIVAGLLGAVRSPQPQGAGQG